MPDQAFERWREAEKKVADTLRLIALAESPAPAGTSPMPLEELQAQLLQARAESAQALSECLEEAKRQKRTSRQVGIDSDGATIR